MGSSIGKAPLDEKALKYVNRLEMPPDKIQELWQLFNEHDPEKRGQITITHFFHGIVEEEFIVVLGEGLLALLGIGANGRLNFSEFVQLICAYSTFAPMDLMKIVFYLLDRDKTGLVDCLELKHFMASLWIDEMNTNVRESINRLEQFEDSVGMVTFPKLEKWCHEYPQVYYPVQRIQMSVMRMTLGAYWWENKKAEITEKEAALKKKTHISKAQKREIQRKKKEKETEEIVKTQLGPVSYYVLWWQRKKIRDRINAIHVEFDRDDPRNQDIKICTFFCSCATVSRTVLTRRPHPNTRCSSNAVTFMSCFPDRF
jgi:Ca2+-binding EF-hand superfamily protein